MTEWDWNYFLIDDETFAYLTGLSRDKLESVKQKESESESEDE